MSESQTGLRREAGLFQVVTYGVGAIIGAGIYVLVGDAAGLAGGQVWLAFMIAAVVGLFTGLTYAELASMYPKAASEYIYLGRAYGSRWLSFMTEWMMLVTEVAAVSAISLGFAGYLASLTRLPIIPVAAAIIVALTGLNAIGIKQSLRINTALSLVAVAGLLLVIVLGVKRIGTADYLSSPNGLGGVFSATALVFFAYIGFDNISNLAEEAKTPEKTIPRGLLLALAITTILYALVALAAVSLVSWQELATSKAPLALAASKVLGGNAFWVVAIAAMLTTLNTALVQLLVSSRIMFGMAREGVLPEAIGKVSRSTGAPVLASGLAMVASLAFLALGKVELMAKVTSFGAFLTFALVNLALLHLRRVAPGAPRAFKAPVNMGWVSVPGVLGLLSCLFMLTQFDWRSILMGITLPASGLLLFLLYGRRHLPPHDTSLHQPHEI